MLEYAADHRAPGDQLYCPRLTGIAMDYYLDRFGKSGDLLGLGDAERTVAPTDAASPADLKSELSRLRGRGRVWIVVTHARAIPGFDQDAQTRDICAAWGTCLAQDHAKNASVYLFDFNSR